MPTVIEELVIKIGYETDVNKLRKASVEAVKAADKTEKAYQDSAKKVREAQEAAFEAVGKEAKAAARVVLKAAKKTERAHKQAAKEAKDAAADTGRAYQAAAKKATAAAEKTQKAWSGAGKAIGASIAGIGAAVGGGLLAITAHTVQQGKELDIWRKKIGTSAEELGRLELAGKSLNIESDNTREAIKTLRENLGELDRIGTGPALESLKSLGLELSDINNLPIEKQIGVLSDALKGVSSDSKRLSIAIELMGEDGAALIPLLSKGSQEINRMGDAAQATGGVMTDEMVDSTIELNKKLEGLKARAGGVAITLAEAVLPALTDAADGTANWVDENQELIEQDLPAAINSIGSAFGFVADNILAARKAAMQFADALADEDLRRELEGERSILSEVVGSLALGIEAPLAVAHMLSGDDGVSDESAAASQNRTAVRGVEGLTAEGRAAAGKRAAARNAAAADVLKAAQTQGALDASAQARRAANQAGQRALKAQVFEDLETATQAASRGERGSRKRLKAAEAQAKLVLGDDFVPTSGGGGGGGGGGRGRRKKEEATPEETAPLLSGVLGENVPDIEMSALARGTEPQVLISEITNNFAFDIDQAITGQSDPAQIGRQVATATRDAFEGSIEQSSRTAKVQFAR